MTVHELDAPAAYPYEADLIGAVLHGYPNIPELARILTAGDFDQPAHRQIWEAILAVHRDGQGVDSATVFAKMGLGAHRLPGGATYLIDLSQQSTPVTAHNVTFYAEKIQEARLRRDIRGLGARCTQIDQSDIEPREAIKLIREWADSIETRGPDLVDLSQAALEAVIDVAENGEPNATPTPWRDLTEALGGWYPNELITVPGAVGTTAPPSTIGPPGPPGTPAQWTEITQTEYDELSPPNPNTLYVIVG